MLAFVRGDDDLISQLIGLEHGMSRGLNKHPATATVLSSRTEPFTCVVIERRKGWGSIEVSRGYAARSCCETCLGRTEPA